MKTNGTKLSLDYDVISGPYGNTSIQTKIDGESEELPFKLIYLKESPFEVLKNLGRDYNVDQYQKIKINCISSFEFKKHVLFYGLSIKEANLEEIIINNEIKDIDLSFIPKLNLTKEQKEGKIKTLIREYIITTHTEYGPITGGLREFGEIGGRGPHHSFEKNVTANYFQERKKLKDPKKEKQLSQILEYAQAILDKPKFSLKNFEEMVFEKVAV